MINGEQKIELNSGYISFKNYSNKIRVPFKIYADFECILKNSKKFNENNNSNKDSSSIVKTQDHVPCRFGYKVVCIDDKFTKDVVIYRESKTNKATVKKQTSEQNCVNKFIDAILNKYEYCKKIMKDHFNKNLIMSMKEEEQINVVFVVNYLD